MSLENLKPFQVKPDRIEQQEIEMLVNKVSISSKVSEIQQIFDRNISLCAYMLKAYINYSQIYFLSTSLILQEDNRPDYICGCFHKKTGMSWYVIVCAGPQDRTWDDEMQLTPVAKKSFDRLNYCTRNLARILLNNKLASEVDPDRIYGLLIIGQDREFFENRQKQIRKRDFNKNSKIKIRTYGAFLRKSGSHKSGSSLGNFMNRLLDRLRK